MNRKSFLEEPLSSSISGWVEDKEWCAWEKVPSMCEELEKRIKEGKFGKVEKYTWG